MVEIEMDLEDLSDEDVYKLYQLLSKEDRKRKMKELIRKVYAR